MARVAKDMGVMAVRLPPGLAGVGLRVLGVEVGLPDRGPTRLLDRIEPRYRITAERELRLRTTGFGKN